MTTVTFTNPTLSGGTVSFDLTAEVETLVKLAEVETPAVTAVQGILKLKLAYAAAIQLAKMIPPGAVTPPAGGNVDAVVAGLVTSLTAAIALAKVSPTDF